MPDLGQAAARRTFTAYYAATALFLVLDLGFGLSLRVSFLDAHDGWRFVYYGLCFACFFAIIFRPQWALAVTALESLATMVMLILSFWLRILPTGDTRDVGSPAVTTSEVVNFLISGGVAWLAWSRSVSAIAGRR